MKNIEIQSILRDVVKEVEKETDLGYAKDIVIERVEDSLTNSEDKVKICNVIRFNCRTQLDLIKYLYNSILAYEGCRVINKSLSGGRIK